MIAGVGAIVALLWVAGIVVVGLIVLFFYKPWHALSLAALIALSIATPVVLPFAQYKLESRSAGFDYLERNNIRGNESRYGVRLPEDDSFWLIGPSMPRTISQKLSFAIEGPLENFPISFSITATNKTDLSIPLEGCEFAAEADGLLLVSGAECAAADAHDHVYLASPDSALVALLYQNGYDEQDHIKYMRVYHNGFLLSVYARRFPRAEWEEYLSKIIAVLDAHFTVLSD